jgi:hypothetical protein
MWKVSVAPIALSIVSAWVLVEIEMTGECC